MKHNMVIDIAFYIIMIMIMIIMIIIITRNRRPGGGMFRDTEVESVRI